MNDLFRQGYRDAIMGEDWIREDMPLPYYEGVAKAMRELAFWDEGGTTE